MFNDIINQIRSERSLVYTVLLLLEISKDTYSIIPELAHILNKQNLYDLCSIYGGQKIQIPMVDELESVFKELLVYYLHEIQYYEWDEIKEFFVKKGLGVCNIKSISPRIRHINKLLEQNQIDLKEILHNLNGDSNIDIQTLLDNTIMEINVKKINNKN